MTLLSKLLVKGGSRENNAFIMQIGDYYFVEFSGTGNACYVYRQAQLPFNPDSLEFILSTLKQQHIAANRLIHMGDWESKADATLARMGIVPSTTIHKIAPSFPSIQSWQKEIPTPQAAINHAAHIANAINSNIHEKPPAHIETTPAKLLREKKIENAIEQAKSLLQNRPITIETKDLRSVGGAFWIYSIYDSSDLAKQLRQLGFGFIPAKGFWIK